MCMAAAPDLIIDLTVRATLNARRAEAGVDVDQQRQVAHVGDAAHVGQHVVEVGDAEIGQAQRTGRDAAAGQIDGAIAGALGQQRMVGVDGADHLQRRFFLDCLAECGACGSSDSCLHLCYCFMDGDANYLYCNRLCHRIFHIKPHTDRTYIP